MPRPNKLGVPYRNRAVILPKQWDDILQTMAHEESKLGYNISVSQVVRRAIFHYLRTTTTFKVELNKELPTL